MTLLLEIIALFIITLFLMITRVHQVLDIHCSLGTFIKYSIVYYFQSGFMLLSINYKNILLIISSLKMKQQLVSYINLN